MDVLLQELVDRALELGLFGGLLTCVWQLAALKTRIIAEQEAARRSREKIHRDIMEIRDLDKRISIVEERLAIAARAREVRH